MKKSILYSVLSTAALLSVATPTYAILSVNNTIRQNTVNTAVINTDIIVTTTATPTPTKTLTIKPIKNIQIQTVLRKTNAIKEIDRRLELLKKLTTLIQEVKRLTSEQKTILLQNINQQIADLETLKTKIDAETDATTLKQQKQAINDSYKMFGLYLPEIEIIAHADKIITIVDALYIKTDDPSLKQTLSEAKTKAQTVIDSVIVLSPQGTTNKAVLQQARTLLKEARTTLNTVYITLKAK